MTGVETRVRMQSKFAGRAVCVLATVCLMCGSGQAWAFCIGWDKSLPNYDPQYYSVSHEFRRSIYVVEVQVVREIWLDEDGQPKQLEPPFQFGGKKPWGFDPYMGAYYDLHVLKSFKGDPPQYIRLFSENSTARFWFDVGSRQVLFLSEQTFDPPVGRSLTVDTCGNSQPIANANGLLGKLDRLDSARVR